MIVELIKLTFEQAKNETPNTTKTGLSKHISKKLEENDNSKIFSYKTFTRYYDKYIGGKEGVIDQPQTEIVEELCKYIGYESYEDFVSKNKPKREAKMSVVQENDIIDNESISFKANRKLITKIEGNTVVSNKALISFTILIVIFMSYFNNDWNRADNDFSLQEYYEKSEREEFIKEKVMFENARSTFRDTNYFARENKLPVLAYEKSE